MNIIKKIYDFCLEYSNVAGNRTKDIKLANGNKFTVPAYFLSMPYVHLHHEFLRQNPECQVSLSTFRKYIPKNFLRGTRKRTDMCHYCVNGKKSVAQLEKIRECENLADNIRSKIEKVRIFFIIFKKLPI